MGTGASKAKRGATALGTQDMARSFDVDIKVTPSHESVSRDQPLPDGETHAQRNRGDYCTSSASLPPDVLECTAGQRVKCPRTPMSAKGYRMRSSSPSIRDALLPLGSNIMRSSMTLMTRAFAEDPSDNGGPKDKEAYGACTQPARL